MDKECCGTCFWHICDRETHEWCCGNVEAEPYGLETDYKYCCDEYEERK